MTDKQQRYAFFKDKIVPLEEAKISIMNHAFMYGTAVFEGVRGYWNEKQEQVYLFRLKDHFERMFDSMKIMYMETQYSIDDLCKIVVELVQRNNPRTDIYIRPSIYKAGEKIGAGLENNPSDISIFTVPFGDYFHGAEGLKVVVSSWRRVEDNAIPARAKIVGAYANTALAKTEAMLAGYDDCIVLSENGHVSEGSAMNIFIVRKGELITPPGTENILEGVTRATIAEMMEREFALKTTYRSIDRSELYIADEIFFCGTGAQITSVLEVDKRVIGNGHMGKMTKRIKDLYLSICHGEKPGYENWLTPVYPAEIGQTPGAKVATK